MALVYNFIAKGAGEGDVCPEDFEKRYISLPIRH